MKRWAIIVSVGFVLLIGAGALGMKWFYDTFERVEEEIDLGYSGLARVNPFYAAELMLTEMGIPTESRFGLGTLPPKDHVVVVLTQDRHARRVLEAELRDWVFEGGRIIVFAAPESREYEESKDASPDTFIEEPDPLLRMANLKLVHDERHCAGSDPSDSGPPPPKIDEDIDADQAREAADQESSDDDGDGDTTAGDGAEGGVRRDEEGGLTGLLRFLGFHRVKREVMLVELPWGGKPTRASIACEWTLEQSYEFDTSIFGPFEEQNEVTEPRVHRPVMDVPIGQGRVSVFVDRYFMTNDIIGDNDHARLVSELVRADAPPEGAILIVRAHAEGLFAVLWQHGWMVFMALASLLVAWVWMASRRFGPTLPDSEKRRRSLTEHIEAMGAFLWRTGYHEQLLDSARKAVKHKLAARLGGDTELEGDALEQALSLEMGMRESRVHEAFYGAQPKDKRAFTDAMRELQRLWRAK